MSVKIDDLLVEVDFGIRDGGRRNVCEDLFVCTSYKRIFWYRAALVNNKTLSTGGKNS